MQLFCPEEAFYFVSLIDYRAINSHRSLLSSNIKANTLMRGRFVAVPLVSFASLVVESWMREELCVSDDVDRCLSRESTTHSSEPSTATLFGFCRSRNNTVHEEPSI